MFCPVKHESMLIRAAEDTIQEHLNGHQGCHKTQQSGLEHMNHQDIKIKEGEEKKKKSSDSTGSKKIVTVDSTIHQPMATFMTM